jgi:hypothetical protein
MDTPKKAKSSSSAVVVIGTQLSTTTRAVNVVGRVDDHCALIVYHDENGARGPLRALWSTLRAACVEGLDKYPLQRLVHGATTETVNEQGTVVEAAQLLFCKRCGEEGFADEGCRCWEIDAARNMH